MAMYLWRNFMEKVVCFLNHTNRKENYILNAGFLYPTAIKKIILS
jgi:hypothetical protein